MVSEVAVSEAVAEPVVEGLAEGGEMMVEGLEEGGEMMVEGLEGLERLVEGGEMMEEDGFGGTGIACVAAGGGRVEAPAAAADVSFCVRDIEDG